MTWFDAFAIDVNAETRMEPETRKLCMIAAPNHAFARVVFEAFMQPGYGVQWYIVSKEQVANGPGFVLLEEGRGMVRDYASGAVRTLASLIDMPSDYSPDEETEEAK